jgi:endonuclease/exonuclease/phosphatase family metal-dependent hydrolase
VVCLAGDFNAPLTAPELEPLTSDGLISAGPDRPDQLPQTLLAAGHETGRPEQGASPGRAIDHIVVLGGGARIVRRTLALTEGHGPDRLTASDHAAVIVELEPAILATTSGSN